MNRLTLKNFLVISLFTLSFFLFIFLVIIGVVLKAPQFIMIAFFIFANCLIIAAGLERKAWKKQFQTKIKE